MISLIRPNLVLYTGKRSGKLRAKLSLFRRQKKLSIVKTMPDEILLQMQIDFVLIDIVVTFENGNRLRGFLDTPIGNLHFTGTLVEGS